MLDVAALLISSSLLSRGGIEGCESPTLGGFSDDSTGAAQSTLITFWTCGVVHR